VACTPCLPDGRTDMDRSPNSANHRRRSACVDSNLAILWISRQTILNRKTPNQIKEVRKRNTFQSATSCDGQRSGVPAGSEADIAHLPHSASRALPSHSTFRRRAAPAADNVSSAVAIVRAPTASATAKYASA
jgi:hypothetical protein